MIGMNENVQYINDNNMFGCMTIVRSTFLQCNFHMLNANYAPYVSTMYLYFC